MLQKIFDSPDLIVPIYSEIHDSCSVCDSNEAIKVVEYQRVTDKVLKRFKQALCADCFKGKDFQQWMKENEIVSIKNIDHEREDY